MGDTSDWYETATWRSNMTARLQEDKFWFCDHGNRRHVRRYAHRATRRNAHATLAQMLAEPCAECLAGDCLACPYGCYEHLDEDTDWIVCETSDFWDDWDDRYDDWDDGGQEPFHQRYVGWRQRDEAYGIYRICDPVTDDCFVDSQRPHEPVPWAVWQEAPDCQAASWSSTEWRDHVRREATTGQYDWSKWPPETADYLPPEPSPQPNDPCPPDVDHVLQWHAARQPTAHPSPDGGSMPNPIHECVAYIHGITPGTDDESHAAQYQALHDAIASHQPDWPTHLIPIEWGTAPDDRPNWQLENHQLLAKAQRELSPAVLADMDDETDFTWHVDRMLVQAMRPLMLYGFSDIFYYASADGKASVRQAIVRQITASLFAQLGPEWELFPDISLTLVGHSAGSVAAFDLLYYLYTPPSEDAAAYLGKDSDHSVRDDFDTLRTLAMQRSLRVRRMFTFGSPITMMAMRNANVVAILAEGQRLQARDYGFHEQLHDTTLDGPRWINYWDKDDPIAWPVQPLMGDPDGTIVRDHYLDSSDSVTKAHTGYWTRPAMHKHIAKIW